MSRRTSIVLGILLVLGALLHLGALGNPPLFDDHFLLEDNPLLRADIPMSRLLLRPGMTDSPVFAEHYRPLLMLSLWQDARVFGTESPWGFRFTNLIIHLICFLFLFRIIQEIVRTGPGPSPRPPESIDSVALTGAALWLTHPMTSEAINLVQNRNLSLCALFLMIALLDLKPAVEKGGGYRVACLGAAALAMLVKEVAAMTPALLGLWAWQQGLFGGPFRRRLWGILGLSCLAPALFVLALLVQGATAALHVPWPERLGYLAAQPEALVEYLRLLLWPSRIVIAMGVEARPWPLPTTDLLGLLGVAGLLGLSLAFRRRFPLFCFFLFWAFFWLLPTSSIIPLSLAAAPMRLYMASLGFFLLLALGLERFRLHALSVARRRLPQARLAGPLLSLLPLMLLLGWWSSETLVNGVLRRSVLLSWQRAVEVYPRGKTPLSNLCATLNHLGRAEAARIACQSALERDPASFWVASTLVELHIGQGDLTRARALLEQARRRQGWSWPLGLAAGRLAWEQGDLGRARAEFGRVLTVHPGHAGARVYLAAVLHRLGLPGAKALLAPLEHHPPPSPDLRRLMEQIHRLPPGGGNPDSSRRTGAP